MTEHHLDDTVTHAYWDREVDVRLEIESGDVVVIECAEPIGQVTPTWTDGDFATADPSLAHALSGAIYVKGARPGDTLEIDILKMEHKGWGWSGHIPEFGLLADDFDSAHLHHWELDGSICRFADGIELPAEPFPGVVGVAPRERPPRYVPSPFQRRQPRHQRSRERLDCMAPHSRRRCVVLDRRLSCRARRRRGLRDRRGIANDGDGQVVRAHGPRRGRVPSPAKDQACIVRFRSTHHDCSWSRPLRECPHRDPLHDRLARGQSRTGTGRRLPVVQHSGQPADQRNRGCAQLGRIPALPPRHLPLTASARSSTPFQATTAQPPHNVVRGPQASSASPRRETGAPRSEEPLTDPSGWGDSNSRPLVPQTSALTKLRHSPYACGAQTLSTAEPDPMATAQLCDTPSP